MTDTAVRETLARTAAGTLMIGLPELSLDGATRQLVAQGVRNFLLFGRNIGSADDVRALTEELRSLSGKDSLIAIDHEGGRVNRLASIATAWPSPMAWAATGDLALVRRASRAAALELASLGINLNFAPVADVLGDHRNPVLGTRCFSDDPHMVAAFCVAFIEGHHDAGVGATAKHFPGHGATPTDSHEALPRIDYDARRFREHDLIPFKAAVEARVDCLMVSHVWYALLDREPTPATLSGAVVRLAREELGFDGAIVTDCMEMDAIGTRMSTGEAVVRSFLSGIDMVMASGLHDRQREAATALTDAARAGHVSERRVAQAHARIDAMRARMIPGEPTAAADSQAIAREIADRAITLVRDDLSWLPLRLDPEAVLGIVTFPATRVQVEDVTSTPPIVAAARARREGIVHAAVHEQSEGAHTLLGRLEGVETVVVATAFATGRPWQGDVVRALLSAGKRVVVVSVRDPYDLLVVLEAPCYVAAYDDSPPVAAAAVSMIFGDVAPKGRLPVELPRHYPRGRGLMSFG